MIVSQTYFWVFVFASENGSDEQYPPVSQSSCNPGSVMANLRRKSTPVNRFSPPDSSSASNGKNVSALSSNTRRSSGVSRKLNNQNWDVQVSMTDQGYLQERDENETSLESGKSRLLRPEMNRALLNKNSDDRIKKHGGSKAGSRVVPYHDEIQNPALVSNVAKDLFKKDKESEELSLIRNQLHQIEKQQSSLLDLLQVCFLFLPVTNKLFISVVFVCMILKDQFIYHHCVF